MRLLLATVISCILLTGCDNSSQPTETAAASETVTAPVLDEALILSGSGLKPVKKYSLDDGHGFYMQESPVASIEFRTSPDRINLSLRTFSEAEFKEKNEIAQDMVTKLAAVITGTDGKFIERALSGDMNPGKTVINGLPVNVSVVENSLLVTIDK
ncbi:hypothetical protein LA366_12620 [Aeromonas jandaei]|uniref:Lipoprotein n=1 Tax=Aeromonas jandaei TaxID=650 RepID=A0A7T4DQV7_AERJA|nr:hypothetical protein [Aeromonas jandaei]QQB21156.1 hypothetical protein I6H43_06400 [Aeromonas jandaei]UCA31967.1 hypothetical protein LA366_12620 [Aeromonas jandaei]